MGIKIWLDNKGLEQTMLTGSGIERIEREVMERRLSEIQGQFIIDFGFEGKFEIKSQETQPDKNGVVRARYMIAAADARTTATLQRQRGWLNKFVK